MTTTYVLTTNESDHATIIALSVDGASALPRVVFIATNLTPIPPHFIRAVEDHINHLQFDFVLTEDFCFSAFLGKSKRVASSRAEARREFNPNQLVLDGV